MPTIEIPEATYQRLTRRGAALKKTVEELAVPALDEAFREPGPTVPLKLSPEDWQVQFDEWQVTVRQRANRYPLGFEADVSRESIYEGCGE